MADRYAAHRALEGPGHRIQEPLRAATVGLIGVGGLGCPVAQYLVSSGIGRLEIYDFDRVSLTNLARQFLYRAEDDGRFKTEVAVERLARDNPDTELKAFCVRADDDFLAERLPRLDLLVDASDNYGTRLAANRACLAAGKPWIMGACARIEGQLALFDPRLGSACYNCLYGAASAQLEDCPGSGILATVAGTVGLGMAHLTVMFLCGLDREPGFMVFDPSRGWQSLGMKRDPGCAVCSSSQ